MKKVLYIIDDINYNSGAKSVTLLQMKQLQQNYDVSLLSLEEPRETIDFLDSKHILEPSIWKNTEIYAASLKNALKNNQYSLSQKISRVLYAISLRCGMGNVYFERLIKRKLLPVLESFDIVIVVSEASKLRRLVSNLKKPKKIQWIHTDYARWSEFSEWSKAICKYDQKIYPRYNKIVVLSNHCKQGLIKKIPSISDKVVIIPNFVDGNKILKKSKEVCTVKISAECLNFVTVARIDREKRIEKILELAQGLKRQNINFCWYIIGDGPIREELEQKKQEMNLNNQVVFLGHLENPYPVMSRCDKMILVSKYEGTPVTIDEAMVLGIGIIAPNIGGIAEQTKDYKAVQLFDVDKKIKLEMLTSKHYQLEQFDFVKENAQIYKTLIENL